MDFSGAWAVVPVIWVALGLTIVISGLLAERSSRASTIGVAAVSALWLVGGAGANVAMLVDGVTYTDFAEGSEIPFVRETWESLVVPHHHVFIGLLIAGEALAAVLVLVPGPVRRAALLALVAFNATLVVFGWAFAIWAVPLVVGLSLLHRAERLRTPRRRPSGGASSGHHRSPRSRVPSP